MTVKFTPPYQNDLIYRYHIPIIKLLVITAYINSCSKKKNTICKVNTLIINV